MDSDGSKPLLRDEAAYPEGEVLKAALGGVFPVFESFLGALAADHGLVTEWRFYRDGGAWLCKAVWKKKTVCWLSVWDGAFTVSCFFTEKNAAGAAALDIAPAAKRAFSDAAPAGKLRAFVLRVVDAAGAADALRLVAYKKTVL